MQNKRVYVLGAGFSHHAHIPMVRELREGIFEWLGKNACLDPKIQRHMNPGPRWPMGKFASGLSLVDHGQGFEELLIDLRKKAQVPEHWHAVHTMHVLERACVRYLWEKQNHCSVSAPYIGFAHRLREESAGVITFNWDLVCEKALKEVGCEWSYEMHSAFAVIKPHGSINWVNHLQSNDGRITRNPSGFSPIGEGMTISWMPDKPFEDPLLLGDSDELRQILFPGNPELSDPENKSAWEDAKRLWDATRILISGATEIVFIGYSLPNYDSDAREWLRRFCTGKKIVVCNPSTAVITSFKQNFSGETVLGCPFKFEDSPYAKL